MNINTILDDNNFIDKFYTFNDNSNSRPVTVTWGGTGLHTIAGPTPFVDISKSFNTNDAGILESIVHTINLTGKIIKPDARGITNTVSGIKALEGLFKACSTAPLKITCDGAVIFEATGVIIKNMAFNKTPDNWVQSADYTIDLEYKSAASDEPDEQVEDRSETWGIEPLDDAVYTRFTKTIAQKPEYSNPNLLPSAPSVYNPVPGTILGGGSAATNNIQIFNIPQFRITRRLSAKGITKPPPSDNQACLSKSKLKIEEKKFFLSAKAWVDKHTALPFNGNIASGSIYFTDTPNSPYSGTWLYNHSRTINADIYNATYEVNDSWIAMPTGIPYIENFSIEASTDNENIKTVRIAGNIQGLHLTSADIMTGKTGPFPSGTGSLGATGNMKLDLTYSLTDSPSVGTSYGVPSVPPTLGNAGSISKINQVKSAKYLNALEAWTKDIKPYLYRRACLAMNTDDRVALSYVDPDLPPPNHIYTPEKLLNVIPVTTSEGHDPIKGTISYNHEFNNRSQIISGVLSENIRVNNTAPASLVQETQILGRALGPLLSSAGMSNPRKSISVDIVVPKGSGYKSILQTEPSCPLYYNGYFWKMVNTIIQGHEPFTNRTTDFWGPPPPATSQQYGTVFKESDNEDWNATEGRYSRTVSWIYQHCTTNRFYLDH